MNSQDNIFQKATALVIVVLIFIAFYLTLSRVDSFIRNQAIDECAKFGRQEQVTDGLKVSYPLADIYETCLERKGIN